MATLTDYEIPHKTLSEGRHTYTYNIDDDFFSLIEDSLIAGGQVGVTVEIDKIADILTLDFSAVGFVKVTCDVCLGEYNQPLEGCKGRIVVKPGERYEELTDELCTIPATQGEINIAQWIYEIIAINLPMRLEHPQTPDGNSGCDPEMLRRLRELAPGAAQDGEADDGGQIDPRWEALKNLQTND